jgi:hypothetical protein
MKKDIFDNNTNPFTVPDEYFDTLQQRITSRINTEENKTLYSSFFTLNFRRIVAVAACILLVFAAAAIYVMYADKQTSVAEITVVDDDFYQFLYTSDRTALLAETLDIFMPAHFANDKTCYSEEDEAIIRFLERENVNLMAILYSINDEIFILP